MLGNRLCQVLLAVLCCAVAACTTHAPRGDLSIAAMNQVLLQGVYGNQALAKQHPNAEQASAAQAQMAARLLPQLPQPNSGAAAEHEPRFDIDVKDAPVKAFYRGLVKDTPYNVVFSQGLNGQVTLNLKNVTVREVMAAVRDVYGYEYEATPYGFRVQMPGLQTRLFHINYLNVQRYGQSQTQINPGKQGASNASAGSALGTTGAQSGGGVNSSSSVTTVSRVDFWSELQATLQAIVGEGKGQKVVINPQAGIVVVSALPEGMRKVSDYLASAQKTLNRQVIMEAKILEVELNAQYASGINWETIGFSQQGNRFINNHLTPFNGIFSMHTTNDDFSGVVNLLSQQGRVKVLSSPRISTINNQKAVIKVGKDEYFVTDITSNTSTASGGSPVVTQDVDLTPFFSGIALDVTPNIDAQDNIILHIHPVISTVTDQEKRFTVGGKDQVIPMALTQIRESDSVVQAQSGQVVVIGGLMKNRQSSTEGGAPILSRSKHLGSLFKDERHHSTKSELVILLRPVVVNDKQMIRSLRETAKRIQGMARPFAYHAHLAPGPAA